MEIQSAENWEDAVRAVFRRSMEDVKFRALAVTDARAAFAEVGWVLPEESRVRFVERLEEHVLQLPSVVRPQNALSEIDVSRILYHAFRQQSIPLTFPEGQEATPAVNCGN